MRKTLLLNKTIDKKEIKIITNWFVNNFGSLKTTQLLDKLKILGFKYATKIGTSLGLKDLRIPKTKKILIANNQKIFKKLKNISKKGQINIIEYENELKEKWNQINEVIKNEINDNFRKSDLLNPIYVMVVSGARGNISQIKQLVGMRGLMVDPKGEVINIAITSNLKESLNIIEYFISCYGARKGVIDTAIKTATSGHLTRKLIYLVQDQIIKRPNCGTKNTEMVLNYKKNKNYYKITLDKILGRVISRDIKNENLLISAGQDICNYLAKKIINTKKIFIRSPLTCKVNFGICQLCYGWNLANNRMVELGEPVGIIAAQSIGEHGTQLTMRTFHTGGIFSGEIGENITSPLKGKIFYNTKNHKKIINVNLNSKILLTLSEKKLLIIENKEKKFLIKLPKYTLVFAKNKEKVFKNQIIGELLNWKKIKNRIKTKTKKYKIKGIKNIASGKKYIYTDIKNEKKKQICIINGNIITNDKIKEILEINNSYSLKHTKTIKKDITIKNNSSKKTKASSHLNIKQINKTQYLNKEKKKHTSKKAYYISIQKLKNHKHEIITDKIKTTKILTLKVNKSQKKYNRIPLNIDTIYCSQTIEKRKNFIITKKVILYKVKKTNISEKTKENLVKKGTIIIHSPEKTKKTKDIVQGLPKIEEILENKNLKQQRILDSFLTKQKKIHNRKIAIKKSIYKIQNNLVKKIQLVYSSQGIKISNKHIEVIIRKITSKVIILNNGESNLVKGEIVELNKVEKINNKINNKIKYNPLILGISKTSTISDSIIANCCFREVIENLTTGAIEGKIDWLNGIKENIIMGNLIPAGTGKKINYQNN